MQVCYTRRSGGANSDLCVLQECGRHGDAWTVGGRGLPRPLPLTVCVPPCSRDLLDSYTLTFLHWAAAHWSASSAASPRAEAKVSTVLLPPSSPLLRCHITHTVPDGRLIAVPRPSPPTNSALSRHPQISSREGKPLVDLLPSLAPNSSVSHRLHSMKRPGC